MDDFRRILQNNMEIADAIANKIECGEAYMDELKGYLPSLSQTVTEIFRMMQSPGIMPDLNPRFVTQVLQDIVYGIENEDSVFLLDVLRYGLMEIYYYIAEEMQSGG